MQTHSRASMRLRAVTALIGILLLVGCGNPQPTPINDASLGREKVTPFSKTEGKNQLPSDLAGNSTAVAGIPTVTPARTYDPDGDGFMDTTTLIQAVDESWSGYAFPPGYQFAIERFQTEFESRIDIEGQERWQLRYNNTIVSIAQTCAWVEYWIALYPSASDNDTAIQDANRMFTEVFPHNFVFADMRDMLDQLGSFVVLGDIASVQQIYNGMQCQGAFYRPDWSGPLSPTPTTHSFPHWRFTLMGKESGNEHISGSLSSSAQRRNLVA